ncbi:FAD-dependent oxidoreductase [Thalassospiraceae bacterium LMO-JJ14]|nr:FAD-dependent oxidoreductase [Thalassospiraceae bacterium LMO-JJ14]
MLGAGIVGLLTAYNLSEKGYRVTIVDEASAPANGCSYGNAGIIAVGHAKAWAGPETPRLMLNALLGRDPAVKVAAIPDWNLVQWGAAFLGNCSGAAQHRNSERMRRLSLYSRELLRGLDAELAIDYHQQHEGVFYIFRDTARFEEHVSVSEDGPDSSQFRTLSAADIGRMEPALSYLGDGIAGGFYSSVDSSGDCYMFAQELARRLVQRGNVTFRFGQHVSGFNIRNGAVESVTTQEGLVSCDGVAVALGTGARRLLRTLGVNTRIYPVKGYSATYPVRDPKRLPDRPFIDETELVAVSRFGQRLRITGMAEFDRGRSRMVPGRCDVLDAYAKRTFGSAIDIGDGQYWAGSRPSTPQGPPFLGAVKGYDNLWVNAGHGQLGWTMAAGAGRVVADLVAGKTPEIANVSAEAEWLISV